MTDLHQASFFVNNSALIKWQWHLQAREWQPFALWCKMSRIASEFQKGLSTSQFWFCLIARCLPTTIPVCSFYFGGSACIMMNQRYTWGDNRVSPTSELSDDTSVESHGLGKAPQLPVKFDSLSEACHLYQNIPRSLAKNIRMLLSLSLKVHASVSLVIVYWLILSFLKWKLDVDPSKTKTTLHITCELSLSASTLLLRLGKKSLLSMTCQRWSYLFIRSAERSDFSVDTAERPKSEIIR